MVHYDAADGGQWGRDPADNPASNSPMPTAPPAPRRPDKPHLARCVRMSFSTLQPPDAFPVSVAAMSHRVRRIAAIGIVVAQLLLIVRAYSAPIDTFGFQMFPESSQWQADIFRVLPDGSRIDIREPWPGGYRWEQLVDARGLGSPFTLHHADAGLDATVHLLDAALTGSPPTPGGRRDDGAGRRGHPDPQRAPSDHAGSHQRPAAVNWRAWDAWLDEPIDPRSLVVLRLAIGPLVLLHLLPFLERAAAGVIYRDRFWLPYADWYPHLPRGLYVALLWATAAAGFLVSLGLVTRLAAWACAGGVAYNLFLSQTHFHHNRAFLLILLVGVAAPGGCRASCDRCCGRRLLSCGGDAASPRRAAPRDRPRLPGLGPLQAPRPGLVGRHGDPAPRRRRSRPPRGPARSDRRSPARPGFHAWAAKAVVLTEAFIGAGLLWRRTRLAAVWVAIPFHIAIEATAAVQVFSWAALAALVVWVTPQSHDRAVALPRLWQVRVVRGLDWTGRFAVSQHDGVATVTDRDGTARRGARAWRWVATRLPLTFWFAALARDRRAYASAQPEKGTQ
jgi:hypothetical protein